MLDDLDAIPWRALRHAMGEATEVPRLIRELSSADRETRQTALKDLFACLLHQGTVYEATARAVPFLFRLLAEESTPDRSWLAFLLASIGDGQGSLRINSSAEEQRFRELFAERGTTLEAELEQEARVLRSVQSEIGRGVQLLVPFLSDGQSEIRAAVARALGRQMGRAAELIPALAAAEATETAADVRDTMHRSVEQLRAVSA